MKMFKVDDLFVSLMVTCLSFSELSIFPICVGLFFFFFALSLMIVHSCVCEKRGNGHRGSDVNPLPSCVAHIFSVESVYVCCNILFAVVFYALGFFICM